MSNDHQTQPLPKPSYSFFSILSALGFILVFAIYIALTYLPNRPGAVDEDIVKDRKAKLAETRSKQHELVSSYAWVDKTAGTVRIPVERAMELSVQRYQTAKNN
jgi:hypothetical protein